MPHGEFVTLVCVIFTDPKWEIIKKCDAQRPTKYVDGPIGPPIYLYAVFRLHILYYLPFLDLQVLLKPELQIHRSFELLRGLFKNHITHPKEGGSCGCENGLFCLIFNWKYLNAP